MALTRSKNCVTVDTFSNFITFPETTPSFKIFPKTLGLLEKDSWFIMKQLPLNLSFNLEYPSRSYNKQNNYDYYLKLLPENKKT